MDGVGESKGWAVNSSDDVLWPWLRPIDAAGNRWSLLEFIASLPVSTENQGRPRQVGQSSASRVDPSGDPLLFASALMDVDSKDRIHFIPLESDPEIFTSLISRLGVRSLEFHDILSLDLADLLPGGDLALPGPVYAFILIFPTTQSYEAELKAAKRRAHSEGTHYTGHGPKEPVIWFEQTIHNACGLYAILHAISNLDPAVAKLSIGLLTSFFIVQLIFDLHRF